MKEAGDEEIKLEEPLIEKPSMSPSLLKFIEADNKAYQEELKTFKDQKSFNKDFYKELAKSVA